MDQFLLPEHDTGCIHTHLQVFPCMCYATSSAYMTLAQKYVVMSQKQIKELFLFYQNFVALLCKYTHLATQRCD